MRALLNAMGVTLWGMIAVTLAVTMAVVAYRPLLNHRGGALTDRRPTFAAAPVDRTIAIPPTDTTPRPGDGVAAPASSTTRDRFRRAAAGHEYAAVEQYGQQLFDDGEATPEDMALIGHFRYLQHDCAGAASWSERSIAASRSRGENQESAYLTRARCMSAIGTAAPVRTSPGAPANSRRDRRELSRVIAKEMSAAQKAMQAQQWSEAIANLTAAEQRAPLTDFDRKTIHHFIGFAEVKLNNMTAAQGEFEQAIATGAATSEEAADMTKALFAIAARTGHYQKTIDYGERMVDAGAATVEDLLIISQSYFQLKDCKGAVAWADRGIASARETGDTPGENFYLFKLQCASDARDNAAMAAVLADLIKVNGKTSYWNTLLRIARQEERDDHNTLMIYRIMYNTQSMKEDSDFIEMAQLLGDAALPGEGAAVLGSARSSALVKDEHKERVSRLAESLQRRSDSAEESLSRLEAEAGNSAVGQLSVKLGEVYYGFGDYRNAVDVIAQGIEKGQIKHLDEAYVYLGLAQVRLGNLAAAKRAFADLRSVPDMSPRLLRLWDLYAYGLGVPLTAAR